MPMVFASLLFEELSWRGWFNPYLAALMAVLGVAIVGLLYVREAGKIAWPARVALAALRMAIIAAVAFLLLRPVWVQDVRGSKPRPVSVMIDTSQSMSRTDGRPNVADQWRVALAYGLVPPDKPVPAMPTSLEMPGGAPSEPSRLDVAKAALGNTQLRLLERLREVGPLDPATFDGTRSGKAANDLSWIKDLKATGTKTALAGSAWELLDRDQNDQPAAVLFVTDGRENGGSRSLDDLARACVKNKVPLFVYGVGSSQFGQVQIRDVAIADTLFVDDTVAVPVRYRVRGIAAGKATITLKLRNGRDPRTDQEVARKEVDVKEGDDLRELLGFVPTKADSEKKDLEVIATVSVASATGPDVVADEIARSIRVVDRKIKVLVVDFFARWDFKFLQRDLLRDRRVDAHFFLIDADRSTMKSGDPWVDGFPKTQEELSQYDLLILGDLPKAFLTETQRGFVRDFVAEGGGLIHISGRNHQEGPFTSKELDKVLPVEVKAVSFPVDSPAIPTSFRPQLTAQGMRNPILSLEDDAMDNVRVWRTLPEMYWNYPVVSLRPGAEALLTHPTATVGDKKPMPMMASHYYGKGYVLYMGFDETWRWRLNEAETYFGRFWSQAVYVAGVGRTVGTRLTQLSLNTTEPVLGSTGQVYARLFGKDFKPLTSQKLAGRLERVGAQPGAADAAVPVELTALPGQPGEFVATLPFNNVGRFTLKVDNGGDKAQLEYRVNLPTDHELAPGGMAEAEMRKLAEDTGGKFYREEDLKALPTDVKPQYAAFNRKEEMLLWNRWAMLLLIGLLTMEWTLRKLNSMS